MSREYWAGISGSDLNNLYNDSNYPNNPTGTSVIGNFQGPSDFDNNYGTRVRGFIKPSETGDYTFNITGNNHVDLFLSTDHQPENATLIAEINNYTNVYQHDKYPSQTSVTITLQADTYYYIELTHKESSGGDHFAAFWQTPSDNTWQIIPSSNLYLFDCSVQSNCGDEEGNCPRPPSPLLGTATDNCSTPIVTMVEDSTGNACNYTITRTWTATDDCGNVSTTSQAYSVADTIAPVLLDVPDDLTLYCSTIPAAPTIGTDITATDNCDSDVTITLTETSTQDVLDTCANINYVVTRIWTATDDCGLETTASQTITMKCECCINDIDDDDDGLVDGTDSECDCSSNSRTAQCELFYYYVPPVWQMYHTTTNQPSVLVLTTPFPSANVNVRTADGTTFNQNLVVTNGTSTEVALTIDNIQTPNANTIEEDRGFIIESDQLLQVYYRIDGYYNKVLVTIKGEQALGRGFRTGSQTKVCGDQVWDDENHFISVMAVEDNTTIDFEFSTQMWGIAGNTHSITLNAGQTYLVKDDNDNQSITGSLVTSDKPIAVLSGSQHTPVCDTYGREGGIDQLVPTCLAGSEYILVKGYGPTYQNYAIAVAIENDTRLFVDGTQVATLFAGDYFNVDLLGPLGSSTSVTADKPFYLYHLSGISTTNGEVGMALVAPVGECRGDRYTEFPKFYGQGVHAAYVIIPDAGLSSLELNGTPYTSYATASPVASVPGYSTIWFDDPDILSYNNLRSDEYFHAALLIGDNDNTGTHGYVTSFKDKIDLYSPFTGDITQSYFVDTLCEYSTIDHCILAASCATDHEIVTIVPGANTGSIVKTGDLCFRYEAAENFNGEDEVTFVVQNEFGLRQGICLKFFICNSESLITNFPEDVTITCTDTLPPIPDPVVTHDCQPDIDVTFDESTTQTFDGSCTDYDYVVTRTWTYTDICNGESTFTQTISVRDTIAPQLQGIPEFNTIPCDSLPEPPVVTATDICDNNVTVLFDSSRVETVCPNTFFLTWRWTAIDACGNSTTDSTTIYIVDTDAPFISTFPNDITVSCHEVPPPDDPAASDNCDSDPNITFTETRNDSICDFTYDLIRTWTWEDDCGLSNSHVQRITVIDTIPPTFTLPDDVTLTCELDPFDLGITLIPTNELDNCGLDENATYTDSISLDGCNDTGIILRTWSLSDICNNTTTGIQTITIIDTLAPTFTPPSDITIACDVDPNNLSITGSASGVADLCAASVDLDPQYTDDVTNAFPCSGAGVITRTWTLEDDCGNSVSYDQIITVIDTVPPTFTIPEDITLSCELDPSDVNNTGDVEDESDNCYPYLQEATFADSTVFDTPCVGQNIIYRVWSLADGCGNIGRDTQIIVLEDNTPPAFTVPVDITMDCNDDPNDLTQTGDVNDEADNCFNAIGEATFRDSIDVAPNSGCASDNIIIRLWSLADACGNVRVDTQTISILDTLPPVLTIPSDVTIDCNTDINNLTLTGNASVTDACGSTNAAIYTDSLASTDACGNQVFIRLWSVIDDCNNRAEGQQTISILDTLAPSFTVPADVTMACDADPNDLTQTGDVVDESDACSGTDGEASYTDDVMEGVPCGSGTRILRTWTLTDNCGNSSTAIQTITLEDAMPPIFSAPLDVTIDCAQDPTDLSITGDVLNEFDDCTRPVDQAGYVDSLANSAICGDGTIIIREWSLTDACGNVYTADQIITIVDNIAPTFTIPSDITISCSVDVNDLNFTGDVTDESDNCTQSIGDAIYTDSLVTGNTCGGEQLIFRRWTLSDECNNTRTGTQIIYLIDTIAPTFTVPVDVTVDCSTDLDDLANLGDVIDESDDCSFVSLEATYTDIIENGTPCPGESRITRVWMLMDACNNTSRDTQIITFIDTLAPVFVFPDDVTLSCESSIDTLVTGSPSGGVDNCDPFIIAPTFTDSLAVDDPCPGGNTLYRIWRASDNCGNEVVDTQRIIQVDDVPPSFTVPDDVSLDCTADLDDLTLTGNFTDGSDNCDTNPLTGTYRDSIVSTDYCMAVDPDIMRIWMVSDGCGNVAVDTQRIFLLDTVPPTFTVPIDATISCEDDPTDLITTGDVFDENDNCTVGSLEATYRDSIINNSPCSGSSILIRIWTLVDNCNNETVDTQRVFIEDDTPPIFTVPNDVTLSCTDDPTDLTLTGDVTDESDSCDGNSLNVIYTDVISADVPCNGSTTIVRTWIVTDDCDNSNQQTQTIILEDNTPPIFDAPVDITLDCATDITDLTITGDVVNESDVCSSNIGQAVYRDSLIVSSFCGTAGTLIRIWTLTDDCGNVAEDQQTIELIDTVAPVFSVPIDVTLSCGEDVSDLTLTGDVFDESDNCDNSIGEASYRDSVVVSSTCAGESTIIRMWSLTDACENILLDTQRVYIVDTIPPDFTVPDDITIDCALDPDDLTLVGDVTDESDNCGLGGQEATYRDSIIATSGCPGTGEIVRIWTLIDVCNNMFADTQRITLDDDLAPTFTVPDDVTLDCEDDPSDLNLTGDVTDESDNCSTIGLEATYTDSIAVDEPCNGTTTIYRRWRSTDECGNIAIQEQIIILEDSTPPVFDVPTDITLDCSTNLNDLTITGDAINERDICSSNIGQATYRDSIVLSTVCGNAGTLIRIWMLSDDCGNVNEQQQTIEILDTIAPVFSVPIDVTLSCGEDVSDLILTGDVFDESDICDDNIGEASYRDSVIVSSGCTNESTVIRIWSLADACGNTMVDTQRVYIVDTIPPSFTVPDDLTVDCATDPDDLTVVGDVTDESDNCGLGGQEAVYRDSLVVTGGCPGEREFLRIWTLVDVCNNVFVDTQRITFNDEIAPTFTVPDDVTIDCTDDPSDLTDTGDVTDETDNCSTIGLDANYTDSIAVDVPCNGSTTIYRTWVSTDECGNVATAIQIILLEDTTPPIFDVPADITLDCATDIDDLAITGDAINESDICSSNLGQATYRDSIVLNTICGDAGTYIRIWTLSDDCGNVYEQMQTIELLDTIAPEFTIPVDVTLSCEEDIDDLTLAGDVFDESDNCDNGIGEATYRDSVVVSNVCAGQSSVYRIWSLADGCGNMMVNTQRVYIVDTLRPIIINAPADTIVDCDAIPDEPDLLVDDNCSTLIDILFEEDRVDGACDDTYSLLRTWTVTDECGNVRTTSQTITVINCGPEADVTLSDAEVCAGESVQFSVSLNSNSYDNPVYQWQFSDDGGMNWQDIAGADQATYSIPNTTTDDEGTYKVLIGNGSINLSDSLCFVISNELSLVVYAIPDPTNISFEFCEGDSINYNGVFYSQEGIYNITLSTVEGNCDSLINLQIVVNEPYLDSLLIEICEGVPHNGVLYNNDTTWTDSLQSVVTGCDSTVVTQVVINNVLRDTIVYDLCAGFRYEGVVYLRDSIIADTFVSTTNCDSISYTNIIVHPHYELTYFYDVCVGDEFLGYNIYSDTTIIEEIFSVYGCDSMIVSNLTVHPNYEASVDISLCPATEYHGNSYVRDTIVTDTLQSFFGCDSIVTSDITILPNYDDEYNQQICSGDLFNGIAITSDTTITDSLQTTSGCDSIVTVHLEVLPVYLDTMNVTLCEAEVFQGITILRDTNFYNNMLTVAGCDSIEYIVISVLDTFETRLDLTICDGEEVTIGSSIYSITGNYIDTLSAINGCDSIIRLSLNVIDPVYNLTEVDLCVGDAYEGTVYTNDTIWIDTLIANSGCDSLQETRIYLRKVYRDSISVEVCEGETFNGINITADTLLIDSLQSVFGCDSLIITEVDYLEISRDTTLYDLCAGFRYQGVVYLRDTTIVDTFTNAVNCDSLLYTNIIVHPHYELNYYYDICEGDEFLGYTIFSDTVITENIFSVYGCDSMIVSNITVHANYNESVAISICPETDYNGNIYVSDTIVIDTLQSFFGCDSIVTSDITVLPSYDDVDDLQICSGDIFNGISITNDTTIIDSLQSINGCDSVVTTNLEVLPTFLDTFNLVLCEAETYQGIQVFRDTNFFMNMQTVAGCDSIEWIVITVLDTVETNLDLTLCEGDEFVIGDSTYNSTGIYIDTLQAVNGCDSIVRLDLEIVPTLFGESRIELCENETYEGNFYTQDTSWVDTLTAVAGCDSLHRVDIIVRPVFEDYSLITLCEGDAYDGEVYTMDTTLIDSLLTVHGCDSIILTELNYIREAQDTSLVAICSNELFNGEQFDNDTTFVEIFSGPGGCDSTHVTILTVYPAYEDLTEYHEICEGDSLLIGGVYEFESGIYTVNNTTEFGCDSIVNIELVVHPSYYDLEEYHICLGDSIFLFGEYRTESELFSFNNQTVSGCDSIYEIQLFVEPEIEITEEVQLCMGDDVWVDGVLYDEPTTIRDTFVSAFGCDSIHVIAIIWVEEYDIQDEIRLCIGDSTLVGGDIQTEPGIYIDTLTSRAGCDSIVTTTLVFVDEFRDTLEYTICSTENFEGNFYNNDTTLVYNYIASGGCDSIEVINLTVLPAYDLTTFVKICEGDSALIGEVYYSEGGTYVNNYQTVNGCDSIVSTVLEVDPNYYNFDEVQICEGDSILLFGDYHYESQLFSNSYQTINGCDSIVELQLTVTNTITETVEVPLCRGDGIWIDGVYYTDETSIRNTFVSHFGCDSIFVQEIVFVDQYEREVDVRICEGEAYFVGGAMQTTAGTYVDTLTSITGCDSIIFTHLALDYDVENLLRVDLCEGETIVIAGVERTQTGTYVEYLQSASGCDSMVTTELYIHIPESIFRRDTICKGESIYLGGADRTLPGVYVDHYKNQWGCDSVITTQLFIESYIAFSESYEICLGDSIFLAGAYRKEAGLFIDTLESDIACAKILFQTLYINEITREEFEQVFICEGDSAFIAGAYRYEDGEFMETFEGGDSCGYHLITELFVQPEASPIGFDTIICRGEEVQLFVDGNFGAEISWTPSYGLSCTDCPDPIASPLRTTQYTAFYNDGCPNSPMELSFNVVVNDPPILTVSDDFEIIKGDSALLVASANDPNITITWTTGDGFVLCEGCDSLWVNPEVSTTYYVSASTAAECSSADLINVNVNASCVNGELEVSNIIIPGSGGYGDHLEIKYDNVEIKLLRIYNRWGEMVYETDDITQKWDGTFRGQPLNPGVYVYYIIGVCLDEEKFIKVGNVTLMN